TEQPSPHADGGGWVVRANRLKVAAEDRVGEVVGQAVPAQLGKIAGNQVAGAPAGEPGVQGDDDAGEARRLGPGYQAGGQVPVGGRIELEETRGVAELRSHVLQRIH